jgi:DNA-binding PadR family transcriptional regulator
MTIPTISSLEIHILAALGGQEYYGLQIVDRVKAITDKSISLGSLYTTLHRMEKKGLVKARWGDTNEDRAGARRRYYEVTALGHKALTETHRLVTHALDLQPKPGHA